MIKIVFVFFAISISHAMEKKSEASFAFYTQIKQKTGISLQQALLAVEKKDAAAMRALDLYVKRTGTKNLEKKIQAELDQLGARCEKLKSPGCEDSILDLKNTQVAVRDMGKNYENLNDLKKIYLSLVIYTTQIENEILSANWDEKNFPQVQSILDMAREITRISAAKLSKTETQVPSKIRSKINEYEKR